MFYKSNKIILFAFLIINFNTVYLYFTKGCILYMETANLLRIYWSQSNESLTSHHIYPRGTLSPNMKFLRGLWPQKSRPCEVGCMIFHLRQRLLWSLQIHLQFVVAQQPLCFSKTAINWVKLMCSCASEQQCTQNQNTNLYC